MTPWSKRLAILLAVSIGVNLLLAGVLLGRGFGRPRGGHAGPRPDDSGVEWREGRRHPVVREAVERRRGELSARRGAIEAARAKVRDALGRDPFDRALLEAALTNVRTETAESQALLHGALVEGAASATLEQRRELARNWDSKKRRGKP